MTEDFTDHAISLQVGEAFGIGVEGGEMQQEKWQPLLEGELAERAWEAIRAIAREIEPAELVAGAGSSDDWGLSSGAAGRALFYAYLAEATGEEAFADRALGDFEGSLACAAAQPFHLGLWQGLLGVTFSFDHLAGRLFEHDEADLAEEGLGDGAPSGAESLLLHNLQEKQDNYDLMHGLVGYGVACLEGLPRQSARQGLDRVLDHLLENVEKLETGCGWFTPPELLPQWQAELAPAGYHNLGVAHGIPAVVVLLARCIAAGIRRPELLPVLEGTVAWIATQRGAAGFPSWVPKGRPPQKAARLAWCYGDPGIAATLLVAANAVGRESWAELAVDVALKAAARDVAEAGVIDSGICHGAAGLAHIFNRLWQASGRDELAAAARYWFAEVLKMRRPEGGIGGFKSWSSPRGEPFVELQWIDDPGLLTGSAGIGICLLAAVTGLDPEWDRLLLLSGTPGEDSNAAAGSV